MRYEKLFEEGRIGSMVLKNRGVMMPMATDMADKDGIVTPARSATIRSGPRAAWP